MTYIDGFVIPIPTANKEKFLVQARLMDGLLMELGALRVVECWGEDVPHGKQTDFYGAVKATEDETVAFSWIEWPDKATRDTAMAKVMEITDTDPRFEAAVNPMSFDGARMIFGGFEPILILGD